MAMEWQEQLRPGLALKELVAQATAALVSMDAERLEELALCCADLNRDLEESELYREEAQTLQNSGGELKLLHRVLLETRANLRILSRLHAIRMCGPAAVLNPADVRPSLAKSVRMTSRDSRDRRLDYGDN